MSVAKAVVSRPVLWLVVFSLLSITGIFMLSDIAVEMYPDIEFPALVVVTIYPGADPQTVENSVTRVLEAAIANTSGIQKMTSSSRSQSSVIILQFEFGTDIDVKTNRVRENMERVSSQLPDDIQSPMIVQVRPDDQPIMYIAVMGVAGSGAAEGSLSQNDLRYFASNELEDHFRLIEGVASVTVEGGQDPIVRVAISQNRLEAYGITINEIARTLAVQNIDLGAGFIEEGLVEYTIKTSGEFASLAEIANTVVLQTGGADIRLHDIGEVFFDYENERSSVFVNGEPGVYISIMKQMGANTIQVADQIYRQLEIVQRTLPPNISLEIVRDDTVQTRNMLNELINSAVSGISLAMIILIIFLRNANSSIIVGLSIPLSFVITLLVMSIAGITVNMMTLAGLILGLGMTVDCSIVVVESITAYRERGEKPTVAGMLAGEEVMSSLIAGTLTTLCVFVPIILFKNQLEIIGILIQDMVFTIAISIIASLFVGIFLVPVLASKWLPVHSRVQKPLTHPLMIKIDSGIDNTIKKLSKAYQGILAKALQYRLVTVLFVVCAFLGSVFAMGRMDISMMPPAASDTVIVEIEMPLGTRYSDTIAVALELQEYAIAEIRGLKNIVTTVGDTGRLLSTAGVNTASITVVLDLDDPNVDSEDDVKNKLRPHFANFPDAEISFAAGGLAALLGSSDIDIMLNIDDLGEGMATAERVRQILETRVPELQDIAVDLSEGLPQIDINIDRSRAYNFGLNIASIAMEISAAMNGVTATTLRQGGEEFDVFLQLAEEDRLEVTDLGRIDVRSSRGMLIPAANFAEFEVSQGPVSINRENQSRVVHITANLLEGFSLRRVEANVRTLLEEEGIQASFAGSSEDTRDMMQAFGMVIVLALLLVFGVMAAQYESFLDPFINFCTIPLLMIGVVMVHIITGATISSFTMIGIVLLIGIVTNNGILLVDYTNQLVRKGKDIKEACVEAGGNRFRPVLMTALTTMLGLAPMAFFPGQSARVTSAIGLVVFGGLASATVITLVFIPVLYSIFHGRKKEQKDEV